MAFQLTYPESKERWDAQALRYWAANAPDMHEPTTYQQEPRTLEQQAIEDRRTEATLERAAESPRQPALPERKKSEMFGLDFKGMTGAPPPPDQPNRGLPLNQNPQTDYKPSRTADWKKWQQKMMQFSGAKSPAEVAAVNEQMGLYKQRRFNETWNQAMALHQQGNVEDAAQLYQRAYDYITNGQGATMRGDPQSGKVLAMPFHEESGVAGKPQAFNVEDAREVLTKMSPAVFGRDPAGQAQMAWAQEQRAQQLHPSAVALQEAKVETEGARPGYIRSQERYMHAQSDRAEQMLKHDLTKAEISNNILALGLEKEKVATNAREVLRTAIEDINNEGPAFQEMVRSLFPEGDATPQEIATLRQAMIEEAIDTFAYDAMPEEVVKGNLKAQTEALKAQAKAMASQEITPDYTRKISEAVDSVFSPTRMKEGKASSDLLEQAFWGQSGAGLDQVKSYAQRLINAETQNNRYMPPVEAVYAMKSFYTHPENTKRSPDGSFYVTKIPETGQLIEMPADVVEPMRRIAEAATVEANRKLENRRQTRESQAIPQRALPTGGFESGPGGSPALEPGGA